MAVPSVRAVVSITPTFLLRSIDHLGLINRYLQGEFQQRTDQPLQGISTTLAAVSLAPTYGTGPTSAIYTVRDKNHQQVIYTTNHGHYMTELGGQQPEIPCPWCRQRPRGETVGPPIRMTEMVTPMENGPSITLYFDIDTPIYCCFQCCLADLRLYQGQQLYRDALYIDTESMLSLMYERLHPNAGPLQPALDWRLHEANGGPLTDEEYRRGTHKFTRTTNIICRPIKVEYTATKL